jgi:hypothetical protein
MTAEELEQRFPKLKESPYFIRSAEDPRYNCVAFAAGDERNWWEQGARLCYWPPGVDRGDTLESWARVFEIHGYKISRHDDYGLELNTDKIAIYVDLDLTPTHVARQLPDGRWKSKLGKGHDIEHDSLDALEGDQMDEYGIVAQIMKRVLQ